MSGHQRRADGIDRKEPGKRLGIEGGHRFFGAQAIGMVEQSACNDHPAQGARRERVAQRTGMGGGGGDARLVGQVDRRLMQTRRGRQGRRS